MSNKMDRRRFLSTTAGLAAAGLTGGLAGGLAGCKSERGGEAPVTTPSPLPKEVTAQVAAGGDSLLAAKVGSNRWVGHPNPEVEVAIAAQMPPADLVKQAVATYGGMSAFVKSGDTVILKPNLAWGKPPEGAANVNPEVLGAVIQLCQEAGASGILVVEHAINATSIAFDISGAAMVCKNANVRMLDLGSANLYKTVPFKKGVNLTSDEVALDVLECDCLINIAIMKHHTGAGMCGCMKNLMGAVWNRQRYHAQASMLQKSENLQQCIADLNTAVRPTLCILDAVRCLLTNGPQGPGQVKEAKTVMVSTDPVALDTLGAQLCGFDLDTIGHLKVGAQLGIGKCDPAQIKVKKV